MGGHSRLTNAFSLAQHLSTLCLPSLSILSFFSFSLPSDDSDDDRRAARLSTSFSGEPPHPPLRRAPSDEEEETRWSGLPLATMAAKAYHRRALSSLWRASVGEITRQPGQLFFRRHPQRVAAERHQCVGMALPGRPPPPLRLALPSPPTPAHCPLLTLWLRQRRRHLTAHPCPPPTAGRPPTKPSF